MSLPLINVSNHLVCCKERPEAIFGNEYRTVYCDWRVGKFVFKYRLVLENIWKCVIFVFSIEGLISLSKVLF